MNPSIWCQFIRSPTYLQIFFNTSIKPFSNLISMELNMNFRLRHYQCIPGYLLCYVMMPEISIPDLTSSLTRNFKPILESFGACFFFVVGCIVFFTIFLNYGNKKLYRPTCLEQHPWTQPKKIFQKLWHMLLKRLWILFLTTPTFQAHKTPKILFDL